MTSPSNSTLHALLGRGNVPFYDFVARRLASWQLLISILAEERDKGAYSVPGMNERSAHSAEDLRDTTRDTSALLGSCDSPTRVAHRRLLLPAFANYSRFNIVFMRTRIHVWAHWEIVARRKAVRNEGNVARTCIVSQLRVMILIIRK